MIFLNIFFGGDNPRMGGGHVPSVPPGIYAHAVKSNIISADMNYNFTEYTMFFFYLECICLQEDWKYDVQDLSLEESWTTVTLSPSLLFTVMVQEIRPFN